MKARGQKRGPARAKSERRTSNQKMVPTTADPAKKTEGHHFPAQRPQRIGKEHKHSAETPLTGVETGGRGDAVTGSPRRILGIHNTNNKDDFKPRCNMSLYYQSSIQFLQFFKQNLLMAALFLVCSKKGKEFPMWLSQLRTRLCLCEDAGLIPDLAQCIKDLALPRAAV